MRYYYFYINLVVLKDTKTKKLGVIENVSQLLNLNRTPNLLQYFSLSGFIKFCPKHKKTVFYAKKFNAVFFIKVIFKL